MSNEQQKEKLLSNIHDSYRLLYKNLAMIPRERWTEPGIVKKWSIKDVLAHIHQWHLKLLEWHKIGLQGTIPETPHPGLKWNQLPQVNEIIYQMHKDSPLEEVEKKLQETHDALIRLVEETPADALFTRGYWPWLGNSYFKSYVTPNTSGHYNWAKKHVRTWMKNQGIK